MTVVPTAKILLFLALQLGPHNPGTVYATSNSESYVWQTTPQGWSLEGKGFPANDYTRDPDQNIQFSGTISSHSIPTYLRAVAHHDWRHNSAMVFDNGDRVEKHGNHAFYIINAGGANQKVFTIYYPPDEVNVALPLSVRVR